MTRFAPLNTTLTTAPKRHDAIRVAQIGLAGGVGYLHINEYEKNPNFQLVGGYDKFPEEKRVAAAIERLRKFGAKIYASFDEVLADKTVDAIDICTPHHFHRPMAVAAFRAPGGGKHVLVEKPMATHPDDCEQMIAAQKASGKVGAVQMQAVGRSSMLELRDAIQSGALGRIREVFLSSLWWRSEEYYGRIPWAGRMKIDGAWCVDGALYNQCIHYVNQMLTLVSPGPLPSVARVKNLHAAIYKFHDCPTLEAGDTAFITATLDSADAPRLTAIGTTCSKADRHQIEILGDKGRALWNGAGYLFPENQPMREFHDDRQDFDGNSRVFNAWADAIRASGADAPVGRPAAPSIENRNSKIENPITAFHEIQAVTKFINDCYDSCNWQIKKAPWSATETLFSDVIERVRAARCLPAELPNPPEWA